MTFATTFSWSHLLAHEGEPALELRAYDVRDLTAARRRVRRSRVRQQALDRSPGSTRCRMAPGKRLRRRPRHGTLQGHAAGIAAGRGSAALASGCWRRCGKRKIASELSKPGGEGDAQSNRPIPPESTNRSAANSNDPRRCVFNEVPLADAVGTLRDVHGLPIELDMARMPGSCFEPGQLKVSLDVHDVPLPSILKRVLGRMGLAFVIHEQTVLITTAKHTAETSRTAVYPVHNLVDDALALEGSDDGEAYERLIAAVRRVVVRRAGRSSTRKWSPCRAPRRWCAFSRTPRTVESRKCSRPCTAHTGNGKPTRPQETLRRKRAKVAGPLPRKDRRANYTRKFTSARRFGRGRRAVRSICARLITEQIEPHTWHGWRFAVPVGDSLVVRHSAAVQHKVARLLRKLDVLAREFAGGRAGRERCRGHPFAPPMRGARVNGRSLGPLHPRFRPPRPVARGRGRACELRSGQQRRFPRGRSTISWTYRSLSITGGDEDLGHDVEQSHAAVDFVQRNAQLLIPADHGIDIGMHRIAVAAKAVVMGGVHSLTMSR